MKKAGNRFSNRKADIVWYALCFVILGLIDQRRGSAEGTLQMTYANLTGIVVGMLLLPSMKPAFRYTKLFRVWSFFCIPGAVLGCVIGQKYWMYAGQWYTAVANIVVIGYLLLYIVWNWQEIKGRGRLNKGCFLIVLSMLIIMVLSVHETLWPAWFLFIYGSLYLIGIPKEKEETFLIGMMLGIIVWFFIQQTIAFGFRPYDCTPRYRGLYSGETQNGIFYMVVFCAFTGMWLLLKKRKEKPVLRILCFVLSAGSVAFQLFTGSKASFLGLAAAAVVAYMAFDIIISGSFRHWILQGIMLWMCIAVLIPIVYGSIRYLPTILHHPIWFEGEYNEQTSVHSYDPWNSERYVSYKNALRYSVGRILQMMGIDIWDENGQVRLRTHEAMLVHAAELGEHGNSPENFFSFEETDFSSSSSVRRTIYYYYFTHLNLAGHSKNNAGFYMADGLYYGHAHNMFLQIAYDYGIIAGLLFLIWNVQCLIRLLLRKDMPGIICATFLVAILVYGCAEMAVNTGQITMAMLFLVYYFGMQRRSDLCAIKENVL